MNISDLFCAMRMYHGINPDAQDNSVRVLDDGSGRYVCGPGESGVIFHFSSFDDAVREFAELIKKHGTENAH